MTSFHWLNLKTNLRRILIISDLATSHLEHEIIGPRNIQAYKKLGSVKSSSDGYLILLLGCARSPFREFEGYLRIVVGPDKVDIQLL